MVDISNSARVQQAAIEGVAFKREGDGLNSTQDFDT